MCAGLLPICHTRQQSMGNLTVSCGSSSVKIIRVERTAKNIFKIARARARTKSLYLPMNENQHVGKVGNAFARTETRMRAKTSGRLAAEPRTYVRSCKAPQFVRLRFRLSCRGSYEFPPTSGVMEYYRSKTAETLPHKSAVCVYPR